MLQDSHKFEVSHELLNETCLTKNKQTKPLFDLVNILITILVNKEFFIEVYITAVQIYIVKTVWIN